MALYGKREEIAVAVERASTDELPFYCVGIGKFVILSVTTLTLYELYWFYRNWQRVKARTGRDVSPFWRAFFAPIFCYGLASAIDSAAEQVHVARRVKPALVAAAYAVMLAMIEVLPDEYFPVIFASILPLLPMVVQIREIHEATRPGLDTTVPWSPRSVLAAGAGSVLLVLAAFGLLAPPAHVLRGDEVPGRFERPLREAGILEPGERIEYFYSASLFSVLDDGNLLTDRRAISYETVEGELSVWSAAFADVRRVSPQYAESWLDDTVVRVETADGGWFLRLLSNDEGLDREFVGALLSRVPAGALAEPPPVPVTDLATDTGAEREILP